MKLRDLPLAFRRPEPRRYPYDVATFTLPDDGSVRLARWKHPGEAPKAVSQEDVYALRAFLAAGDVAIDIGAHSGDTTIPIALAVGRSGLVFALEPNPYVYPVLEASATLNPDKTRIIPLMFAATVHDGEFEFCYSDSGYCNGGALRWRDRWRHGHLVRQRVEGRNLDAYLQQHHPEVRARVKYIKIDTEGSDRQVATSLAPLIRTARPFIRAEVFKYLRRGERLGFFDDLAASGYRIFRWRPDCYQGEALRRDDMVRWTHFDIFAIPTERL